MKDFVRKLLDYQGKLKNILNEFKISFNKLKTSLFSNSLFSLLIEKSLIYLCITKTRRIKAQFFSNTVMLNLYSTKSLGPVYIVHFVLYEVNRLHEMT